MVGESGSACSGHAVAAGETDGLAAAFVFIVGGHIPDPGMLDVPL